MSPFGVLVPMIALVPLATARAGTARRVLAAVLSAAAVAAAWKSGVVPGDVAAAQVPLWAMATLASFRLFAIGGERIVSFVDIQRLRGRRAELKDAVAAAQRDETRALQIYGAARALAQSVSLEDMGPRLTSAVQRLFGSYEFLLYARQDAATTLLHRRGVWKREPPLEKFPAEAVVNRPPAVPEIVPVLFLPIHSESSAGGALFVKVAPDPSKEAEYLRTGVELGSQLGLALSKALLFRQLELQMRTDGLTGTLRRQAFVERLDEELKRADVFKTGFSVLMLDLDHFKAINDSHGHAAGDAVLARVGKILREAVYETDVVGRYGGEEFIVLLPRSDQEGVRRKAEALRQRIQMERISTGFGHLGVTVSIGIARYPNSGTTAESLIAAADRALYKAKESGRNRVVEA